MRIFRRILQVMLFINFIVGLHDGMRAGNLILILINGVLVLVMIAGEMKGERRYDDKRNDK